MNKYKYKQRERERENKSAIEACAVILLLSTVSHSVAFGVK